MALRLDDSLRTARDRVQPYASRLENVVLRYDPAAQFVLQSGHDPEFWELHAFVDSALQDDPDLSRAIATEGTELLLDFDVAIAVVLRTNR